MGRTCTPASGSRWAFKSTEIVTRSTQKLELAASIHHDVMIEYKLELATILGVHHNGTRPSPTPCGLSSLGSSVSAMVRRQWNALAFGSKAQATNSKFQQDTKENGVRRGEMICDTQRRTFRKTGPCCMSRLGSSSKREVACAKRQPRAA